MTFLRTPPRREDESLEGHLHRLAQSNELPYRLTRRLVAEDPLLASAAIPSPIEGCTASPRFCPRCIGHEAYWRSDWKIAYADACPLHQVWLVDVCARCHQLLRWDRLQLTQCPCGALLRTQPVAEAPKAVVDLSSDLARIARCQPPERLQRLAGLDLSQAVRLVRVLGSYGGLEGAVPQKSGSPSAISTSWPVSSVAAEVIAAWPDGFERLLEDWRRGALPAKDGSLPRVFRGLYVALYRSLKDPEFEFVRHAFATYIARRWPRLAPGRNRRIRGGGDWLPLTQAARRLGVSTAKVREWVVRGVLVPASEQQHGSRLFTVFHPEDVAGLSAVSPSTVSLTEAAKRLGLKRSRLRRLVGPLSRIAAHRESASGPWCVDKTLVEQWERCRAMTPTLLRQGVDAISLDAVLRFSALSDPSIGRLLIDLAEDRLRPLGRLPSPPGIGALVLAKASLAPYAPGRLGRMLTIPQVAAALAVKQEVVYFWVRQGLLQAERVRGPRREEWQVTEDQLNCFEDTFSLARDLAKSLCTSSRRLGSQLAALGVKPASGPGVDRGRQWVYRRADVRRAGLPIPAASGVIGIDPAKRGCP